jgi:hypothetical protein
MRQRGKVDKRASRNGRRDGDERKRAGEKAEEWSCQSRHVYCSIERE